MKNFVVIGGTSGIGWALCQVLEKNNHRYWFSGTHEIGPNAANALSGTYFPFEALNSEKAQFPEIQNLQGLAYFPGTITLKPFTRITEEELIHEFKIHVTGALKCIQHYYPALKNTPGSSVLLISTVAVGQGMPFHAAVAICKGAVEAMVRALAAEMAPHVRINALALSLTETRLAQKFLQTDEKRLAAAKRHPLQIIGTPENIANWSYWMLTEGATWTTGQVFGIDGGLSTLKI